MLAGELEVYLAHLAVERGLSANTLAAYRRDLTRYVAFLAGRGIGELANVSESDVGDFLLAVRAGGDGWGALGTSSAARMLASVRGWHRFAVAEFPTTTPPGALPLADPAAKVAAPKLPLRLPHAIGVDQMQALLDAASVGEPVVALRDRALLELLYSTGARVSEVTALDVPAVAWAQRSSSSSSSSSSPSSLTMIAVVGKGNKERLVPIGGFARAAVDDYLVRSHPALLARGAGTHALFLNSRGRRMSRQTVWEVIQTVAARAGLAEHVTPHTFRHSFATHLLRGGADVRVVQELLGHASVATTQIYTLVTRDHLREVYLTTHPRAR